MRSRLINALFNRAPFIARLDLNCPNWNRRSWRHDNSENPPCDEGEGRRWSRTLILYEPILACEIEQRERENDVSLFFFFFRFKYSFLLEWNSFDINFTLLAEFNLCSCCENLLKCVNSIDMDELLLVYSPFNSPLHSFPSKHPEDEFFKWPDRF